MRMAVTLDSGIARFASRLAGLSPDKVRRAGAEGLNEGGDKERTLVRRDLREQTGVKRYGSVLKRTRTRRATPSRLEYEIRGEGKGMPIDEFPVRASVGAPVAATPWGVPHRFKRSFKTSAKGLLRARRGSSRFPIRSLRGPSVAKEIVKDQTADGFEATAAPLVRAAVLKRLGRLLP